MLVVVYQVDNQRENNQTYRGLMNLGDFNWITTKFVNNRHIKRSS